MMKKWLTALQLLIRELSAPYAIYTGKLQHYMNLSGRRKSYSTFYLHVDYDLQR